MSNILSKGHCLQWQNFQSRDSELRWSKILVHLLVFQNKALPLQQSRNSTWRDTAE